MSKNTRWALAGIGVIILVVAAIVISTGKNDKTDATEPSPTTPATTQPSTPSTGATSKTGTGGATSGGGNNSGGATPGSGSGDNNGTGGASPDDTGTGGAKVSSEQGPLLVAGKVAKINVKQGDTVYVRAKSATDNELHIHGYDYKVNLPAGKTVSYHFKADIGGAFVMEFEDQGLQVAALKVSP